jgi:hypothetical protein
MQTWMESDGQGRQFLVRTGTGVVTAVVPVGAEEGSDHAFCRVEIYCDAPHGRPGAIRYSAHSLVESGHRLHRAALEALEQVWPVEWTIQWHRHDWVPGDLPIASLNLATDARAVLTSLDPVLLPEPVDAIPDFVPLHWQDDRP